MKKHIVFLFSDQHNPNVAGFAGDPWVRTPNLDRLAASGTVFGNCYCASPLCVPSRAAMLSSRLPSNTGIINNFQCLPSDRVTFVHSLAIAGYETVLAGRMHFIGPDQRHGYEKRLVGDITPSFPGLPIIAFDPGLAAADFPGRAPIEKAGPGCSNVLKYDSDVNEAAINYLRTRTDDRPLFLTAGYFGPHCPYVAPKEFYDYYFEALPMPAPVTNEFKERQHPAIRQWYLNRNIDDITPEQTRRVRAAYYGMVEYFDGLIGSILNAIEETIGLENTLIVYSSDHGDCIGDNGLFWKTNFYEGSARVPFVFSSPGFVPENANIDTPVSHLDLGPSLISYAGGPALPVSDGVDLIPVLSGHAAADGERAVFSQLADVKGDAPSVMVRKGEWKLISHAGYARVQLFNIDEDPHEINDLGENPRYSVVKDELLSELKGNWDADLMVKKLADTRVHENLLRRWSKATTLSEVENWVGDPADNHVDLSPL